MTATPSDLRADLPVWARIGLLSFGGPAGQIALMHRECVETRGWIDEDRFLHALSDDFPMDDPVGESAVLEVTLSRSSAAVGFPRYPRTWAPTTPIGYSR